jgi:selenide,water dikinase
VLRPIRDIFNPADYPDLLVGLYEPDDAAVWRLEEDRALVATTDFFTPVVDDPYDYGAIAAANALSDVYAMGGQPFLALNVAALPPDLPAEISSEILRGGAEKVREAGVVIAGGHSVQDKEPKYGLIVLGFVNPARMITKSGARAGDVLLLSKPLGFGVTTTALKREQADPTDVSEVVGWMKRLNRVASELAVEAGVRGGTDVTGFSLLGHGWEMAEASGVGLRFIFDKIPFTRGARRYADEWTFPGGSMDNRIFYGRHVHFDQALDEASQMLLFDAQTSGGLLLSVPPQKLDGVMARAAQVGQVLWEVGDVIEGGAIEVLRDQDR